jgi:hypothetical protein
MLKVITDPTSAAAQGTYALNGMKPFQEEIKLVREKITEAKKDYEARLSTSGEKKDAPTDQPKRIKFDDQGNEVGG